MTTYEAAQKIKGIYNEAIKAGHEAVDSIKRTRVSIKDDKIIVDLFDDEGLNVTLRFYVRDGKVYDEEGELVDLSSIESFFCESQNMIDEEEIIKRLKATIHYQNSLVFKDAVDMLEKMPENSRQRYVMSRLMNGYARINYWHILDNGETEMLLLMFNWRKA